MAQGWIVKLYDENSNHILSLVPHNDLYDGSLNYALETPDGKVVCVGIHENSVKKLGVA